MNISTFLANIFISPRKMPKLSTNYVSGGPFVSGTNFLMHAEKGISVSFQTERNTSALMRAKLLMCFIKLSTIFNLGFILFNNTQIVCTDDIHSERAVFIFWSKSTRSVMKLMTRLLSSISSKIYYVLMTWL